MKLRLAAVMVVVASLVSAASASAAPRLSLLSSSFPNVNLLLTLPTKVSLSPGTIRVRENGQPVAFSLRPGSALGERQFGVVIAIDASRSMHGAAIANAMAAARQFAAHRNPLQPMAVVVFNQQIQTVLPLTTNASSIAAALANPPPLAAGTHIYDAAAQGLSLLHDAHITAGTVIVLSDGADTGSITGQAAVVSTAHLLHARIYTVGLQDLAYDPRTLSNLATAAGGVFGQASAAQISALFASLGSELSNQYLISYRSTAPLGSQLNVAVRVAGTSGVAQTSLTAPSLPKAAPAPTAGKPGFWHSTSTGIVFAVICGLLLFLTVVVVLAPRRSVRRRVERFAAASQPAGSQMAWMSAATEGAAAHANSGLATSRWWRAFLRDLELAGITTPPVQLLGGTALLTALLAWGLDAAVSGVVAVLLALAVPFGVWLVIRSLIGRQRRAFDEQLTDNLQVIASSMRVGHSFGGALTSVVDDAAEPSRREFRRIVADEQLGVPLDDAMERVATRMDSGDFRYVAAVIRLQREAGGNTAEILDRVIDTLRDRQDVRRLVRTLTAQGRLARWIVTALPVFLLIALTLIAPSYMHPLFHRTLGIITLVVSVILLIVGSLFIRRIVEIET